MLLGAAPSTSARSSTSARAQTARVVEITTDVVGQGTIVVGASGQSCTSRCVFTQGPEKVLQLTAVPAPGYSFGNWSGACFGTAAVCPVAPTQASTVQATFVSTGELSLTVAGLGAISSSPGAISCGRSGDVCGATFDDGQVVTLTPAPAPGAVFDGWGGPCAQYGTDPCEIQVGASIGVTASFGHVTPATGSQILSVTHRRASVTSAPDVLTTCAGSDPCRTSVPSGTSVTLDAGGPFVAGGGALPAVTWSGDCVGNWPVCRAIVDGPTNISVAQLSLVRTSRPLPTTRRGPSLVQTDVSGGGSIRVRRFGLACPRGCNWYLPSGQYVTVVAVPARHHSLKTWGGFCRGHRLTCRLRIDVNEDVTAAFVR
jgi:List-Bact-rpt repeat protein